MKPLISPAELAALPSDNLRIFDCTVHLRPDPPRTYRIESGLADYHQAHVPGAAFLDLDADLSRRDTNLRFMLPDAATLCTALGAAGISNTANVVLYASNHPMWATRVWWMLSSLGHRQVALLDGGLGAWRAAGLALESGASRYPQAVFSGAVNPDWWADKATVSSAIGAADVCTINALPAAVHSGSAPVNYGRKGHIRGSINVPYERLLDAHHQFRPVADIRAAFATQLATRQPVIAYCGGGISATIDAFALRLAGHDNVRVYDGSMSEWAADPHAPMDTGD